MKIVTISDTHTMHDKLTIPDGDVLIHAGDITSNGKLSHLNDFCEWLDEQPHKHKIVIAGNHDWCFERSETKHFAVEMVNKVATYLEDSSTIIDGVKFYGSPWQPEFCNWAFNLPRGRALVEKWAMIPDDINVLITHSPPVNILDYCSGGNVGCCDLASRLVALRDGELKHHVFGHIHEGYGEKEVGGIHFVNASNCTGDYVPINPPIVFNY